MKDMNDVTIVLLGLAALILVPLAAIWSVNTLFGAGIVYSLSTWAASLVLVWLVAKSSSTGSK